MTLSLAQGHYYHSPGGFWVSGSVKGVLPLQGMHRLATATVCLQEERVSPRMALEKWVMLVGKGVWRLWLAGGALAQSGATTGGGQECSAGRQTNLY